VAERARREPGTCFVGIDPNHAALIAVSRKAAAAPKKGGLPNARFVLGSAEDLPGPFAGRASSVSVLFPWGGLLRAAVQPEEGLGARLSALCQPGAALEVVYSLDERDASEHARLGIARSEAAEVAAAYRMCGFRVREMVSLDAGAIRAYPTTWARKLATGSSRTATRIVLCRE
jgi:16S rRNA (adenine(1408)-N(1))-methyltransferase